MNRRIMQYVVWFTAVAACTAPVASAATVLDVPFTSQAPFQDWKLPYEEFCEEASVVMAAHFLWHAPLTPEIADREMKLVQAYEMKQFGRYEDTSAEETARILKELYGFTGVSLREIAGTSIIKKEITAGHIVLVPAAGRMLKNPYFVQPGPLYHMVLIRGFDDARGTFLVNDAGTRRGNGLVYSQKILFGAIHDWNNGDVLHGKKVMMVIQKSA